MLMMFLCCRDVAVAEDYNVYLLQSIVMLTTLKHMLMMFTCCRA